MVRVARDRVDVALVDVAEHREPADGVAVERAVADRQLALVAGGEHQPVLGVRDRHQQRTADARLDVLLGEPEVRALAEQRAEARRGRPRRAAGCRPCAPRCRGARRAPARPRGCGRDENGPGIATPRHRARAERLDREVRRHRRVDAAREADHRARRQVLLAEVVADAEHERRLELRHGRGIRHDLGARVQLEHLERRREVRQRRAHAALRVHREGRAVEDQLVVAAHLVAEQRPAPRWRRASSDTMARRSAAFPTWNGEAETFTTSCAPPAACSPVGSTS